MEEINKFETRIFQIPKYQTEVIKHQRDFIIPNSKSLNWTSFDYINNQIFTTGYDGVVYSLNLENLKLKTIWKGTTGNGGIIEFSQIFLQKNYILLFGTNLVILKDEKEILKIPGKSYFRSHCFFSDETIALGLRELSLKIYKFSELLVDGDMKLIGKESQFSGWIYNLVNIENRYIGVSNKAKEYSLIDKNSGETIYKWKNSMLKTVLCSFYDSLSELLFLGTFDRNLIVIDVNNKLIQLVIKFEAPISWILEIHSERLAISTYKGEIIILDKQTLKCEQYVKCLDRKAKNDIYHLSLVGDEIVASEESGILSFWKIKGFKLEKLFEMLKNKKDTNVFFSFC
jgi:WD40 repeat protein